MDIQKFQRIKSKILSLLSEIEADLLMDEAISRAWRSMMASGAVCIEWTDCREFRRWCKAQNIKGRSFRVERVNDGLPFSPENSLVQ